jgi:hypothetical protein
MADEREYIVRGLEPRETPVSRGMARALRAASVSTGRSGIVGSAWQRSRPAGGHQGRGQLAGDPRPAGRSPYRGRRPSVAGEARAPEQARCHAPGGARSDGLGPAGKAPGGSSATASDKLDCPGAPLASGRALPLGRRPGASLRAR